MADFVYDALDFVPVAGTLKNTCEAAAAAADGDFRRAFSKGFEAAISGTLDVVSFGAGGAIAKGMSKTVIKQTGKVVAREVAGIGAACAVRAVRNMSRPRSPGPRRRPIYTRPRRSPERTSPRPPRKQSPRGGSVKTSPVRRPRPIQSDSNSDESITDYSDSWESTTDEESSDEDIRYRTSRMYKSRKTTSSNGYARQSESSYRYPPQEQYYQTSYSMSNQSQQPNQNNRDNNNDKNQRRGPKRGHHIINNDVLKIFKSIIEKFTVTISGTHYSTLVESGHIQAGMPVYEDYHFPLPQDILDEIETELVVSTSEIFADVNAETYGRYRQALEEAMLEYMMAIYDQYRGNWDPATIQERKENAKRRLAEIIEEMIRIAVFIDEGALEIWLKIPNWKSEIEKKMKKLEKLKEAVEQMLRALVNKAEVWAKELIKVIEKYLNPGRRFAHLRRF